MGEKRNSEHWIIPITGITSNGDEIKYLLRDYRGEIKFSEQPEWVIINYGQKNFYRVMYSDDLLQKLKPFIKEKKIPPLERHGIERDLFDATLAGEINLDKYFDLIKDSYQQEDNYFVLENIFDNLFYVDFIFSQEPDWDEIYPKFKMLMEKPFRRLFEMCSWYPSDNEDYFQTRSRAISIEYLGSCGDEEILDKSLTLFNDALTSKTIHPDIKGVVFRLVASIGDKETYLKMIKLYNEASAPDDKTIILYALGMFSDREILEDVLNFTFSEKVRQQDRRFSVYSMSRNKNSRDVILPWFKENWEKIERCYDFKYFLTYLITPYTGKDKETEIREFLEGNVSEYKYTINKSFEIMRMNTDWLERNRDLVKKYFLHNQANTT